MRFLPSTILAISICLLSGCGTNAAESISMGNRYYDRHQYVDASLQYRRAIQANHRSGDAYYRLGLVQMAQQRFDQALTSFERAVRLMPSNTAAKVKLADVSLALYVISPQPPKMLYDSVDRIAGQLLETADGRFDGLRLKGAVRLLDKKPHEASILFAEANRIEPLRPEMVQSWVQALFLDNRMDEGERIAFELIAKHKDFTPVYDVLIGEYSSRGRGADVEKVLKLECAAFPADARPVVQLAGLYASERRFQAMDQSLSPVLASPDRFRDGRLQVGNFLADIGRVDQALHIFDEGVKVDPSKKRVYRRRIADLLIAQGRIADASALVELILKDDPRDAEARRVRATLWVETGSPEKVSEAGKELTALATELPNDARIRFLQARVRLAQGDTSGARDYFKDALRLDPKDLAVRFALASLSLDEQHPGEAVKYSEEILEQDPENERAELLRAAALVAAGRIDDGKPILQALQKKHPDSDEIRLQFALVALAELRFDDAEEILDKLPVRARTDGAHSESKPSATALWTGSKETQEFMRGRRLVAVAEVQARKYNLAIGEYRKMIKVDANAIDLYEQLSEAYHLSGDLTQAVMVLDEALRRSPENPDLIMSRAAMLENAGRYTEARDGYMRVLQKRPDNPFVLNNLASLMVETEGNADDALRLAQRALAKAPNHPVLVDTLGSVYLRKKMYGEAEKIFWDLTRREPDNPLFHYHLAMTLLDEGRREQASSEAEKALESDPVPEVQRQIKVLLRKIG